MWFFITFFIGLIGAGIALKYKVPAGAMIGSLFAVAVFSIVTGKAYLPQSYKVIAQISTGAFIGARIKYNDIIELKKVFTCCYNGSYYGSHQFYNGILPL